MKNWKKGKIIYCPEKYCIICAFGTFFFLFWFGSDSVLISAGPCRRFSSICFVLADKMNGALYRVVSVRNRCLPLQKRAHWKMLIVKMQKSENDVERLSIKTSLSWLLFLLRHPQHLAILRRRIELHAANNSSVHLKTLLSKSILACEYSLLNTLKRIICNNCY